MLPTTARAVVTSSIILSRLDYCNALLLESPKFLIECLQRIQTIAAKLVLKKPHCFSGSLALAELHWLPVPQRIQFKSLSGLQGPPWLWSQIFAGSLCPGILHQDVFAPLLPTLGELPDLRRLGQVVGHSARPLPNFGTNSPWKSDNLMTFCSSGRGLKLGCSLDRKSENLTLTISYTIY